MMQPASKAFGHQSGMKQRAAVRPRQGHGGRPAILLVDDTQENLFALSALLRRDDVDILVARSGTEALELLLEHHVALALVDVHMPEMDGFELATLMRGLERTRRIPIIFVTATSKDERRVFEGYEAGAVDFLFKPIDSHILKSKVDVFVTLEKQRQELRRSEERFRSLVEPTSQLVWRLKADGTVAEGSPSFRTLTGIDTHNWLENRVASLIHPADQSQVSAAWEAALGDQEPCEIEYRIRRPNGAYTWTMARVAPVFDEGGELIEWVGANADIDARKATEHLREMFMAILGHDLRNPLGAIMNAAQLLLLRNHEEGVRRPLEHLLSSGERMLRMIEQLLDLTRVRLASGIELTPVVADLGLVLHQALQETAKGKDRFELETSGNLQGKWDVDRVFQVITNLASNGLEHSSPGTKIQVKVDGCAPDVVTLSVHNLGPPIPADVQAELFEPFRGSKRRRTGGGQGLGLGLFITKQLVLAHGGSITFETTEACGTYFRVTLPRQAPEPSLHARASVDRATSSEGCAP